MSVKVSSWVWHDESLAAINGNELVFLLSLADVADDNGRCRYLADDEDLTYRSLARKVRISVRTVVTLVGKLRELGIIQHTPGAKGRPNEFRIMVPWSSGATSASNGQRDSVQPATHSVQPATRFDANPGSGPSYRRKDVSDVDTSDVASDDLPPKYSSEIVELCEQLAEAVRANGHKVGVVGVKWWSACDRLIRLDGYTVEQVRWMIRWATSDEFWAANIRSMPTLREKFSTLVAQAKRQAKRPMPADRARQTLDLGARLQAEHDARQKVIAS